MHQKGLDWAQHLRGDLVVRIENLEAIFADLEPLRQELERLRSQLKGVERLIAVYYEQLGCPRPAAAESIVLSYGGEAQASVLMQPEKLEHEAARQPLQIEAAAGDGDIGREVLQALALLRHAAARCFRAAHLWLLKLRLPRSAQS